MIMIMMYDFIEEMRLTMINDSTTKFMKGAILGYCQSHEPEEVAMLFDDIFLTLDMDKATNISSAITARYLFLTLNVRDKHNEVKVWKQ